LTRLKCRYDAVRTCRLSRDRAGLLDLAGSVAQLEREIMLEQQREGVAKAKAEGKYRGRAPTARARSVDVIAKFKADQRPTDIAKSVGIGRASVYRILSEAGLV
jgi:DNA invertase Pin-like site-specific DNA recombinase